MDRQLIAIRDGNYSQAIHLAENCLKEAPNDVSSHFTLAQAYEATEMLEKALEHAVFCISEFPDSFEILSLAARCSSELKRYEEAYGYANSALKLGRNPNLPIGVIWVFNLLSYLPRLKGLRNANESRVNEYTKQTSWLRVYVAWYESQSPNQ